MNELRNFLWMCSGANASLLKRCPTDANKYAGIGGTILFTAILAFFSGSYALYTIFGSFWAAIGFGFVWGLMIFNLDRYIVSSMKSKGSIWSDFMIALPRLVIALIIAFVIAKPLELKIFDKEISAELIVMEQEIYETQETQLRNRFSNELMTLNDQIENLKEEITSKATMRDRLQLIAQQEADGTGGSMQANLGPIYRAKKADTDKAQFELDDLLAINQPLIQNASARIAEINETIETEIAALERQPYNGFAARIEALKRLANNSEAIYLAHIFIILLFVAIESAPILVKLIGSRSPYDYLLNKHEHAFAMHHEEQTTLLSNATLNKIKFDTHIGTYKNNAAIETEKEIIDYKMHRNSNVGKAKADRWEQTQLDRLKVRP